MKKILSTFFFVGGGLVLATSVFAVVPTVEEKETIKEERKALREVATEERATIREEIKEERKELREERKERRCERWENRIRTRINRYENNQDQHRRVFNNLVSRIEKLITRFESTEVDVSKLKADLVVFESKITALHSEHDVFMAELQKSQEHACGESEGEFRNQLGEARKMIPEVREKFKEVREYYRDVIRPDILELRKQIGEEGEEENENE